MKQEENMLIDFIKQCIVGQIKDGTCQRQGDKIVPVHLDDEEVPFSEEPCDGKCDECTYTYGCDCECELEAVIDEYDEPDCWGIPDIDRVVFSEPATIVFWTDGTKTVVKCMPGEKFEKYAGFMAACMKKMFGSTSRAKAIMNECIYDQPKPEKKKKKKDDDTPLPGQMTIEDVIEPAPVIDKAIQEAIDEALAK